MSSKKKAVIAGLLTTAVVGTSLFLPSFGRKWPDVYRSENPSQVVTEASAPQDDRNLTDIEKTLVQFNSGYSINSELSAEEKKSFGRESLVAESFLSPELLMGLSQGSEIDAINKTLSDKNLANGEFLPGESIAFVNDGRGFNLIYNIQSKSGEKYYGFHKISDCLANTIDEEIENIASRKLDALLCGCNTGGNLNYDFAKALILGEGRYQPELDALSGALLSSDIGTAAKSSARADSLAKLVDGIYAPKDKKYELNSDKLFSTYYGKENIAMKLVEGQSQDKPDEYCASITFYIKTNSPKFKEGISAANYSFKGEEGKYGFAPLRYLIKEKAKEYIERHPTEDISSNRRY
jgi:hypothetical protein